MLRSLSDFLSDGIFLQGIEIMCDYCGSRFFYNLDEIKQKVVCKGCKSSNDISAESNWTYKLNELLRKAFAFHGVFPLVWILGELLHKSRDSFIFLPCITLHKDYKTGFAYAELDLACIIDGQFLIGEVKSSSKGFSESEIQKFSDVCIQISPHKAIIAAFWATGSHLIKWKNKLNALLKDYDIEVQAIKPDEQIFKTEYHI